MTDLGVLLNENNPRAFLKKSLAFQFAGKRPLTTADISRRAGFSSRSFISEYLSGKKKLSKESVRALSGAFKLPKEYKQFFQYLIALDQPDLKLFFKPITLKELESCKRKIQQLATLDESAVGINAVIAKKNCFLVFAALGTEDEGASLDEILLKLKLSEAEVRSAIKFLEDAGLTHFANNRFFPKSTAFDLLNFTSPELSLLVKDLASEIKSEAETIVNNKQNLLVYSAFTISRSNLTKFRERLREAAYEIMDEFQDDSGDSVHQVFICAKQ